MPGKTLKTCHLSNEIFFSDQSLDLMELKELKVTVMCDRGSSTAFGCFSHQPFGILICNFKDLFSEMFYLTGK